VLHIVVGYGIEVEVVADNTVEAMLRVLAMIVAVVDIEAGIALVAEGTEVFDIDIEGLR
jgi:hypothetical protein